jgi:hypothetical protein
MQREELPGNALVFPATDDCNDALSNPHLPPIRHLADVDLQGADRLHWIGVGWRCARIDRLNPPP